MIFVTKNRSLADAWHDLWDADLLLCRRLSPISLYGRGPFSHAMRVVWVGSAPFVVDQYQFWGGRLLPLAWHVARRPGRIEVYRPDIRGVLGYDREGAAREALKTPGQPYNWGGMLRACALHCHLPPLLLRTPTEDAGDMHAKEFCSQAISRQDRLGGGVDPVPHLADEATEPNDLWRSELYAEGYLFTLVP